MGKKVKDEDHESQEVLEILCYYHLAYFNQIILGNHALFLPEDLNVL